MSATTLPAEHPRLARIAAFQDLARKHKPPVPKQGFAFTEPLRHGWLLPYLLQLEGIIWGRWEHWSETFMAGKIIAPIPEIVWCGERESLGRKEIERSLNAVTRNHDWAGWSSWTYFDYFLDWLLFGFGDPKQKTEPEVPGGCEGASERLYQTFNLGPLLAWPNDYLGDILAENSFGRHSGFFPTPMCICEMMVKMMQGADGDDLRDKSVCDPALGTGRMLLAASNYSYRLKGQDINNTVIKATLVNGYLYAPWLAKPFAFWDEQLPESESEPIEIDPAKLALSLTGTENIRLTQPELELV
jgi:hypothetical protein